MESTSTDELLCRFIVDEPKNILASKGMRQIKRYEQKTKCFRCKSLCFTRFPCCNPLGRNGDRLTYRPPLWWENDPSTPGDSILKARIRVHHDWSARRTKDVDTPDGCGLCYMCGSKRNS